MTKTVVVPRTKSGYLLGYPVDPALPLATTSSTGCEVTMRQVRAISRKDLECSRDPQRLYAGHRARGDETVRTAWRRAEWVTNPTPQR